MLTWLGLSPFSGQLMKNAFLASLLAVMMSAVAQAEPLMVAYDGFDYPAGALDGRNGGSGWTSAWAFTYSSGSDFAVNLAGYAYSGLTTIGGRAAWSSGGNGISQARRHLPLQDSGVVYVQFLSQLQSSSGGGTPNLRLGLVGTGWTGGFGGNGGTYGSVMSILDNSLNTAADGSASSSASLSSLNLVVGRIDYDAVETTMWVNPDLSTFSYDNPTDPDATFAGLAPKFDRIEFDTRSGSFDELSIFVPQAQAVPEPSTTALLMMAVAAGCWGLHCRCGSRSSPSTDPPRSERAPVRDPSRWPCRRYRCCSR
jgi:hypothetical protein